MGEYTARTIKTPTYLCWRCTDKVFAWMNRSKTKQKKKRTLDVEENFMRCRYLTFIQHRPKDGQIVVDRGAVPASASELVLALLDADLHPLGHAGHYFHVVPAETQLFGHQTWDAATEDRLSPQWWVLVAHCQWPKRDTQKSKLLAHVRDRVLFAGLSPYWLVKHQSSGRLISRCGRDAILRQTMFDCVCLFGVSDATIRCSPFIPSTTPCADTWPLCVLKLQPCWHRIRRRFCLRWKSTTHLEVFIDPELTTWKTTPCY